ncbi:MAG: peptidoglycan editing factor PgeF [Candidatus Omnitrophica bacterium]|jgi:hypothetical protein|nr:peptidoglycan editing factor PgeF [Candidatus Omnitrophota bacterium]
MPCVFNLPGLICATSSKPYNMSLAHGDTTSSLQNRKDFLSFLGIDYKKLACGVQAHSAMVRKVVLADAGRGALSPDSAFDKTDAFITNAAGLPMAVFTADCLAVFIYDKKNHAAGIVHAGWRGTKKQICLKTLEYMRKEFSTSPENVYCGFGPRIKSCCYEVGEEFKDFFPEDVTFKGGKYYFDLGNANKRQIVSWGVDPRNIEDKQECNFCNNNKYFSYRKEGVSCGRMMSALMLK